VPKSPFRRQAATAPSAAISPIDASQPSLDVPTSLTAGKADEAPSIIGYVINFKMIGAMGSLA
jgi:hypothetical protein